MTIARDLYPGDLIRFNRAPRPSATPDYVNVIVRAAVPIHEGGAIHLLVQETEHPYEVHHSRVTSECPVRRTKGGDFPTPSSS